VNSNRAPDDLKAVADANGIVGQPAIVKILAELSMDEVVLLAASCSADTIRY